MPFDTTNGLADDIIPLGSRTDPYDNREPDTSWVAVELELPAWVAMFGVGVGCVWFGWALAMRWGF